MLSIMYEQSWGAKEKEKKSKSYIEPMVRLIIMLIYGVHRTIACG